MDIGINNIIFEELIEKCDAVSRDGYLKTLGARLLSESNDLKRTSAALALEIGWNVSEVERVFSGMAPPEVAFNLLIMIVTKYPVTIKDLWLDVPLHGGYQIMTSTQSQESSRIFSRGGNNGLNDFPYYEYRDTAMSKLAPYKPEWIRPLRVVDNICPNNSEVIFNKGHLMNQFTYFIGEVNFYWEENGRKFSIEMNTGDSCHITPFVPHTFASRNAKSLGLIIAVTYGDNIRRANNHLILDGITGPSYLHSVLLDSTVDLSPHSSFNLSLKINIDADLKSKKEIARDSGISLDRLEELMTSEEPNLDELENISKVLNLQPEDLYRNIDTRPVEFAFYKEIDWQTEEKNGQRHKSLARSQSQPSLKTFLIEVNSESNKTIHRHAYHEYLYNCGDIQIFIILNKKEKIALEPGASCYVQPFCEHAYAVDEDGAKNMGQLLIVRLGANFNQPTIIEMSKINHNGRKRLLRENSQWF